MQMTERVKKHRREACRRWRAKNPERANKLRQESRLRNLEENRRQHAAYNRARRAAQPDVMRAYDRKRRECPLRRISECMAVNMRNSLRRGKDGRSWESLVGYTRQQLKQHLEGLWQDGMTWANFGEWHIDHVRPISSFEYATYNDPEFLECWSIDNLQPLWAEENMQKGARYDREDL